MFSKTGVNCSLMFPKIFSLRSLVPPKPLGDPRLLNRVQLYCETITFTLNMSLQSHFSFVLVVMHVNTGVPNSWFEESITRIEWERDCPKCAVLCYTFGRWEFGRCTRHCMERKITMDKIARWNNIWHFGNEMKKIYSHCLVSVVHLAYFIALGEFWGVFRSLL